MTYKGRKEPPVTKLFRGFCGGCYGGQEPHDRSGRQAMTDEMTNMALTEPRVQHTEHCVMSISARDGFDSGSCRYEEARQANVLT